MKQKSAIFAISFENKPNPTYLRGEGVFKAELSFSKVYVKTLEYNSQNEHQLIYMFYTLKRAF